MNNNNYNSTKDNKKVNIGILTFHWATNYGAVLQCYALQKYLSSMGCNVKVINYKPRQYDESLFKFLLHNNFLRLKDFINSSRKEKALELFRNNYLNLTENVRVCSALSEMTSDFDVIISGSDQVVNPYFLMSGEGNGIVTPTYFLGFDFNGRRIGYALSFGCIEYPEKIRKIASKFVEKFDCISVREVSGVDIVKSLGREDVEVVPDPTLLMSSDFYHAIAGQISLHLKDEYVYCFFIRHITDRKIVVNKAFKKYETLWNNEDGDYTMQGWLYKIKKSKFVVTDSFHCVVMCLKLHVPFIVITEKKGNVGMNDRLYTLLGRLDLCRQICFKDDIINYNFQWNYDWNVVDSELARYGKIGEIFLKKNVYENIMV